MYRQPLRAGFMWLLVGVAVIMLVVGGMYWVWPIYRNARWMERELMRWQHMVRISRRPQQVVKTISPVQDLSWSALQLWKKAPGKLILWERHEKSEPVRAEIKFIWQGKFTDLMQVLRAAQARFCLQKAHFVVAKTGLLQWSGVYGDYG